MNGSDNNSARVHRALQSPLFWSIGLGLTVVAIMAYPLFMGHRIANRYVPLMDIVMEIKLDSSIAHLRFEELISGDRSEDIAGIWERFDRSDKYVRTMLEGGETPAGDLLPLRDPTFSRAIAAVGRKCKEFRTVAEQRWAAVERSGPGTEIDQRFDAIFEELLSQAGGVETMLRKAMVNDFRRFRVMQSILIVISLCLSALVGMTLQHYRRRRARDLSERQESEARYRTLLEASPAGVVAIQDGRIVYVNDAAANIVGVPDREAFIGREVGAVLEAFSPQSSRAMMDRLRKAEAGESNPRVEMEIVRGDGSLGITASRSVGITLGGRPAVLQVFQDITERKRAEKELRERQEMINAMVETSREWIWAIDLQGSHTYSNPAVEEILGYRPEELLKKSSLDYMHEDDRKLVQSMLPACISARKGWSNLLLRWRHKDGSWRHLESNAVLILNADGDPVGFRGVDRDITERKKSDAQLRDSEEKFSTAFHKSPHAMALAKIPAGPIIEVNREFERLSGFAEAELQGRSGVDLRFWSAEERAHVLGILQEQGGVNSLELGFRHRSGRSIPVLFSANIVEIGGEPYLLSVLEDITARKRAADELLASRERLRALAAELTATEERERHRIATYLHDQIGQSLAATQMKCGALSEESGAEHLTGSIGEIGDLLEEIMEETRNLTFDLSPPILYELGLPTALEWFGERTAEEHSLQFAFSDDGRPKSLDSEIAALIFRNARELIVNVVKHAEAERLTVSCRLENGSLHVSIEDDGVGCELRGQPHPLQVSGFGLFSIRERMQYLGGRLEIESAPDRGTRATLIMPLTGNEDPPESVRP